MAGETRGQPSRAPGFKACGTGASESPRSRPRNVGGAAAGWAGPRTPRRNLSLAALSLSFFLSLSLSLSLSPSLSLPIYIYIYTPRHIYTFPRNFEGDPVRVGPRPCRPWRVARARLRPGPVQLCLWSCSPTAPQTGQELTRIPYELTRIRYQLTRIRY